MKKLILLALTTLTVVTLPTATSNITTCNGYISSNNQITLYDQYDGNIYNTDTDNLTTGTKVTCILNTQGTATILDDEIINITIN